jgi:sigma-B regulation protein RsbQ
MSSGRHARIAGYAGLVSHRGTMSIRMRNNVKVSGSGPATMFLAHGFGCDQNMWRLLEPTYAKRYRTVVFDLVGSGQSEVAAYDAMKYDSLHGYASDVAQIVNEFSEGPAIFVGHSVSATIGMLADIANPGMFAAHAMVGPSPCYINDGEYRGGFERADIDGLLEELDSNYLGWSSTMAPAIMGSPEQPELGAELSNSFCRTDPEIAKQFARVTFLSDHRDVLAKLQTPALILQCSEDMIAPVDVGRYMHSVMQNSTLTIIDNVGHCPHLSSPGASTDAINAFLLAQRL